MNKPTTESPTTAEDQAPTRSSWWIALAALLPIACCGLPLLLTAGIAAGTGAVLGGIAGTVLLLVAVVACVWALRRRKATTCQTSGHRSGRGCC